MHPTHADDPDATPNAASSAPGWAILVAAGSGERCGSTVPKQFMPLAGLPVLAHSLRRLASHPAIAGCVVVIDPNRDRPHLAEAVRAAGVAEPRQASGGTSRQDSVRRGLEALSDEAPPWVVVHDAARPNLESAVLDRLIAALAEYDGALAATPVADTLKAEGQAGEVAATKPRSGIWQAQTPQAFLYPGLLAAHRSAYEANTTDAPDDAALIERAGGQVALVASPRSNFKITTAADLATMEALLASSYTTCVGSGYDVHATQAGDAIVLCGLELAAPFSLRGHSDADVALHAVTDALLGGLAEGDIGYHFPPSEPAYRNADSGRFISYACKRLAERGGLLRHLDVTVICEAPRVGDRRATLRRHLAALMGVAADRVSIKATTHEGVGAVGRGEAIAVQATATLALPAHDTDAEP